MARRNCALVHKKNERAQMSCAAEMQTIVRELSIAQDAPKLEAAWADVARKLRVTPRRVRDHWYGKAKRIDAEELLRARELRLRQIELEARREAQRQANQLLMVAHRLETLDASFHSEDVAALKRAAAVVGAHPGTVAED